MSHRSRHPACLVGWLVIELSAVPATGRAALNAWTAIGPRAGPAGDIAIDPSTQTIYAVIERKVFKSLDHGATWAESSNGLPTSPEMAVVVDPITPSTVYVTSYPRGVFKSTDGGASWAANNAGLPNTLVGALAVDPHTAGTVYMSVSGAGLFRSTDGAASWTPRWAASG